MFLLAKISLVVASITMYAALPGNRLGLGDSTTAWVVDVFEAGAIVGAAVATAAVATVSAATMLRAAEKYGRKNFKAITLARDRIRFPAGHSVTNQVVASKVGA